jgi:hypothetical protein
MLVLDTQILVFWEEKENINCYKKKDGIQQNIQFNYQVVKSVLSWSTEYSIYYQMFNICY